MGKSQSRAAERLLIVGWDAADWTILHELVEKGQLPTLRRLMQTGVHGPLATLEPRLSPLLWTSVATGKTADEHRILHFVEPDVQGASQGLRLSSSTSRKCLALWNMLHRAGLSCGVVHWYATHPAEPVRGTVISNLFAVPTPTGPSDASGSMAAALRAMPPGCVHPMEASAAYADERVLPADVDARMMSELLSPLPRDWRTSQRTMPLVAALAQDESVHRAAVRLARCPAVPDCLMVFHEMIDTVGHRFMQFRPPRLEHVSAAEFAQYRDVMDQVYARMDRELGALLAQMGPQTTLMLLSDHGFQTGAGRPHTEGLNPEALAAAEAMWHRDPGVLLMHGPGVQSQACLLPASLLDIAPTALALLGLPAGADMPGRVLAECLDVEVPERIGSWESAPGEAGQHPADLRQDPYEAAGAIAQLVDLGYLADLPTDVRARHDLVRRESSFNLGVVHLHRGRSLEAAAVLGALAAEVPDEPRYRLAAGRALLCCAQPLEAAAHVTHALALRPGHRETALLLAAAKLEAGDRAGVVDLLRGLEAEPGLVADHLCAMADLYRLLADAQHAESLYARALALDADHAGAMLGQAQLLLAARAFEPAANRALDVLELHPHHPAANALLATSLAWIGSLEDAVSTFDLVLKLQPGNVAALRFLLAIHQRCGDLTAADEHSRRLEALLEAQAPTAAQRAMAMRDEPLGPADWTRNGPIGSAQVPQD